MTLVPALSARSRARLLARHGRVSPALVCPLVLAQAAEIEALPEERFLTDATKLANGLRALRGAFGNDVINCTDPTSDKTVASQSPSQGSPAPEGSTVTLDLYKFDPNDPSCTNPGST